MNAYLHCNTCGAHRNENARLLLLSCKHVVCVQCNQKSQNHCSFCSKPVRSIEINSKLPENLRLLFQDPSSNVKHSIEAAEFQTQQQLSYIKHNVSIFGEYEALKHEIAKLEVECQQKKEENKNEVDLIEKLRGALIELERNPNANISASLLNTSDSSDVSLSDMPETSESFLSLSDTEQNNSRGNSFENISPIKQAPKLPAPFRRDTVQENRRKFGESPQPSSSSSVSYPTSSSSSSSDQNKSRGSSNSNESPISFAPKLQGPFRRDAVVGNCRSIFSQNINKPQSKR
uniref:CSON007348 protein n=1 Tax=Culicoides sonorensis TaxID=179676 RepID=A0A336M140_CULSO